jgi:hypothetical protein
MKFNAKEKNFFDFASNVIANEYETKSSPPIWIEEKKQANINCWLQLDIYNINVKERKKNKHIDWL